MTTTTKAPKALTFRQARDLPGACFVLLTDGGEVDQICYSHGEAMRERKDLEAMGCTVTVRAFRTPGEAEQWVDHKRGY